MSDKELSLLSKREQQIMDFIYSQEQASASEVHKGIPDAPSYSAVRALLRVLVDKGHLRHEKVGPRYVYYPTTPKKSVAAPALKRVVNTFFEGSIEKAVAALMNVNGKAPSDKELDNLQEMINSLRNTETSQGSDK